MSRVLTEIAEHLKGFNKVLISTHVSPDPDAIGSSFALALALRAMSCESVVYLHDTMPERMESLKGGIEPVYEVPDDKFDAIVGVDVATARRLGGDFERLIALGEMSININHHISNTGWADINYIVPEAAATAQIIHELLEKLGTETTSEMANLMLAGLVDDTGSFRYANVNDSVFDCASSLVQCGALPDKVSEALYFSVPLRVLRLRAVAISEIQLFFDGKIGLVIVDQKMLDECGASSEDAEGIVEQVRSVEGVVGAVFMREAEDGWKLSLRSKSLGFSAQNVAAVFGGGGHEAAAGCKISGTKEEVVSKVLSEIEDQLCLISVN